MRDADGIRKSLVEIERGRLEEIVPLVTPEARLDPAPFQRARRRTLFSLLRFGRRRGRVHAGEEVHARAGSLGAKKILFLVAVILIDAAVARLVGVFWPTDAGRELEGNSISNAIGMEHLLQRGCEALASGSAGSEKELQSRLLGRCFDNEARKERAT